MAFRRNLGKDVDEGLIWTNDKGSPLNTPYFLAVHVLLLHHAKLIADFLVYISKECVRQAVLFAEFSLGFRGVAGDAKNDSACSLELFEGIAKSTCFDSAAGSVCSGIKEEYDGFAFVVREAYSFALVGFKREVGDFRIQFHRDFPRRLSDVTISLHYSRAERRMSLLMSSLLTGAVAIVPLELALLAGVTAWAQYPGQIDKKDKDAPVLRAVGVLEWTGDPGKPKTSRLVPITVFDGDQLQDAAIYLARPAPMAVESGVEYILQKDGDKVGLFDVQNAGQVQGSWVGFGVWKAMPSTKVKPLAMTAPPVDVEESDRPVLHRKSSSTDSASGAGSAPVDPDRPTLHKKPDSDGGGDTTAPGSTTSTQAGTTGTTGNTPSDDPDRPTLKRGKAKPETDTGYVENPSSPADPDRPKLERGKSDGGVGPVVTPTMTGLPQGMQQMVAVSDATNKPVHEWNYSWADPADEVKMKAQLEGLAREALGLDKAKAPVKAKTTTKAAHPLLQVPPPLLDEEFRVFELAYGSGATLVLTARTDGPLENQKFVTLIAQPDLYGNLLVLFKNVTDGAHLDDSPRMRLIDAVDAMADNRGELLFELRGVTQRQFALYRVMRGTAEKLFVTGGEVFGSQAMNR